MTVAGIHRIVPLTTPLLEIPPADLAYWMGKFVLEVHKDGSEYPPPQNLCMLSFVASNVYFEQNGVHNVNPLRVDDSRFGNFRATLDAEMKRLHGKGLGTSSKQAEPITPDEESLQLQSFWTEKLR